VAPTLAQVLNTLAHEIRTPLAVSRGYLKLLLEGGFPSADEQHAALERTREALGAIAVLCEEMGTVGARASAEMPALMGRIRVRQLVAALQAAISADAPVWRGSVDSDRALATDGTDEVVRAVAVLARMAFKDAGSAPRAVEMLMAHESSFTVLIGGEAAIAALPRDPEGADAVEVPVVRGGFGLSVIWAAFVLQHHRVRTWHHPGARGAVGLLFPLVNA
jgi:hypothetical protein